MVSVPAFVFSLVIYLFGQLFVIKGAFGLLGNSALQKLNVGENQLQINGFDIS